MQLANTTVLYAIIVVFAITIIILSVILALKDNPEKKINKASSCVTAGGKTTCKTAEGDGDIDITDARNTCDKIYSKITRGGRSLFSRINDTHDKAESKQADSDAAHERIQKPICKTRKVSDAFTANIQKLTLSPADIQEIEAACDNPKHAECTKIPGFKPYSVGGVKCDSFASIPMKVDGMNIRFVQVGGKESKLVYLYIENPKDYHFGNILEGGKVEEVPDIVEFEIQGDEVRSLGYEYKSVVEDGGSVGYQSFKQTTSV